MLSRRPGGASARTASNPEQNQRSYIKVACDASTTFFSRSALLFSCHFTSFRFHSSLESKPHFQFSSVHDHLMINATLHHVVIIKPCPLAARMCCASGPTAFSSVQFSIVDIRAHDHAPPSTSMVDSVAGLRCAERCRAPDHVTDGHGFDCQLHMALGRACR